MKLTRNQLGVLLNQYAQANVNVMGAVNENQRRVLLEHAKSVHYTILDLCCGPENKEGTDGTDSQTS